MKVINLWGGPGSGLYGKTVKSIWIAKYGQEEADLRYSNWRAAVGRAGAANAQYGKPAPKGSGRGIKGWLNGLFFRSLLEMQYIYYRMQLGDTIVSAETSEFRVSYSDSNGDPKTYHPDFLINNNIVVEVKPSSLLLRNKCKFDAATAIYGDRYLVETEKSFPCLIDIEIYKLLISTGALKILSADSNRISKNLRRRLK